MCVEVRSPLLCSVQSGSQVHSLCDGCHPKTGGRQREERIKSWDLWIFHLVKKQVTGLTVKVTG